MQFYTTPQFTIFFGDQATGFAPQEFYTIGSEAELRNAPQFKDAAEEMQLKYLMALKQVHGVAGKVFVKPEDFACRPYDFEGDYLITSVLHAGLAVATADCLPMVIYDTKNHVVAAAHAGWRGSVAGIGEKVLEEMQRHFGTQPEDCTVVFGPAAGSCCYEVAQEFLENIPQAYRNRVVKERAGLLFFDNTLYNQLQLEQLGVPAQAFVKDYALCTICSPQFCSYRRDKERSQRQMTIVALNSI